MPHHVDIVRASFFFNGPSFESNSSPKFHFRSKPDPPRARCVADHGQPSNYSVKWRG